MTTTRLNLEIEKEGEKRVKKIRSTRLSKAVSVCQCWRNIRTVEEGNEKVAVPKSQKKKEKVKVKDGRG